MNVMITLKRYLILVCLVSSLDAQTAVYPSAVATDNQLKVAVNGVVTGLSQNINASQTSWVVASCSNIVPNMLITIGTEIMPITGCTGTTMVVGSRGFDSTSAATHNQGQPIYAYIDAWHHNSLRVEVEAIEATLGPNLSNVINPVTTPVYPAPYNFPAQFPAGSVVAGNNSTTLVPCPLGLAGSDSHHWVYLSGGTSTAEAVMITGGTCASGAPSGSITFTAANSHSGAWSITSATAGVQEAINIAGSGGYVFLPGGAYAFYAPAFISTTMTIKGAGPQTPIITDMSLTTDVFDVITGASGSTGIPVVFDGISIKSTATQTAGNYIKITAISSNFNIGSQVRNCTFQDGFIDLNLLNVASLVLDSNNFYRGAANMEHVLLANPVNGDGGDNHFTNNWFVGTTSTTGILYNSGGGLEVLGNKFNGIGTGLNATWNASSGQVYIVSNSFDGLTTNGILFSTTGGALLTDWLVDSNFFDGCPTNGYLQVFPNGGTVTRGVISGNDFDGGCTTVTALNLMGGTGYSITGNQISSGLGATVIHAISGVTGTFVGNEVQAINNAGYSVSASGMWFGDNQGINDVIPSVTAIPSLVLPLNPITTINGSGVTITSVTMPLVTAGLSGTFLMSGANTFSAGATIANSCTTTAGLPYRWVWDGVHLFISGFGC